MYGGALGCILPLGPRSLITPWAAVFSIAIACAAPPMAGQSDRAQSERPKTSGPAHAALYVTELGKSRAFYHDLLGLDEVFERRTALAGCSRETKIQTGVNRKRQINLYDPDGTRVELIEPDTTDGQPAGSPLRRPPQRAGLPSRLVSRESAERQPSEPVGSTI